MSLVDVEVMCVQSMLRSEADVANLKRAVAKAVVDNKSQEECDDLVSSLLASCKRDGTKKPQPEAVQTQPRNEGPKDSSCKGLSMQEIVKKLVHGGHEPDWSVFEKKFAKDLLPKREYGSETGSTKDVSTAGKDCAAAESYEQTVLFMFELVMMLMDYLRNANDRSTKVVDFHHPDQLREMMSHCLDLHGEPQPLEQVLSDCKETLKYCVKTGHPRFFNQISQGLDVISVAGEWLTAVTNTNMFTYEVAPVFTLMEDIVLQRMRAAIGWPNGDGDGIFAPGGAIANFYAVLVARHMAMPEIKSCGLSGCPKLVMFQSERAHFSFARAALMLGIGLDNVVSVRTDMYGKMIPADLEAKIREVKCLGGVPFFVTATCGTTVLGSFDPLNKIADICEKHKLWFHVDGAFGGTVILSRKHRHLMSGVTRADSVTWNPHKLLGVTLQCSAILLRKKGQLEATNALKASYLFQPDKHYDMSYDTGDKAIQCGRHNDIFKFWLMWRARGDLGFEAQIDHLFAMSKYMQNELKKREGFEMVIEEPEFLNICFWYIPKNLRRIPRGRDFDEQINKVAPRIKAMMMEKGSMMVGYQPLGELPNFFRIVLTNPALTTEDIDFFLDETVRLGEDD